MISMVMISIIIMIMMTIILLARIVKITGKVDTWEDYGPPQWEVARHLDCDS